MKQESTTSSIKYRPLRLLFAGDASSGKTTLISVLSSGILDNGCGSARKDLLQHQDEKESGHTSQLISYILTYKESCASSERIVHLFDGCGLQTHFKSMVHGFTSTAPDYVCILVDSKIGVTQLTKEHMGIALALGLPIIMVITKTDLADQCTMVESLITKAAGKEMLLLSDSDSIAKIAEETLEGTGIPVVGVSSVTGEGLAKLTELIFALVPRKVGDGEKMPTEVWVRKAYDVPEIGIILEGLLKCGKIRKGQYLKLGPLDRNFRTIIVKSIVTCKGEVETANCGEDVAIKVVPADGKKLEPEVIKKAKGMVLVAKVEKQRLARMFDAEIVVVKKAFVKAGRVVTVHTGNVCQSAKVEDLAGEEVLKQGDKGLIRCKFGDTVIPYMRTGEKVLFRSGTIIAVGVVTDIYYS